MIILVNRTDCVTVNVVASLRFSNALFGREMSKLGLQLPYDPSTSILAFSACLSDQNNEMPCDFELVH